MTLFLFFLLDSDLAVRLDVLRGPTVDALMELVRFVLFQTLGAPRTLCPENQHDGLLASRGPGELTLDTDSTLLISYEFHSFSLVDVHNLLYFLSEFRSSCYANSSVYQYVLSKFQFFIVQKFSVDVLSFTLLGKLPLCSNGDTL